MTGGLPAEVLVPGALGSARLRFTPEFELVQVFGADLPLTEPLEQVLAESRWKVLPPYLRHQSPKVRLASSSLICSCSARSLDLVSRSASWRNRSRSASWAWRPDSTSSAMTRLVLALLTRASARTLRATPAERVTLCRNGLTDLGMERVYTTLHQPAPSTKRNNSRAEGYRFAPVAILIAVRRPRGDPCVASHCVPGASPTPDATRPTIAASISITRFARVEWCAPADADA